MGGLTEENVEPETLDHIQRVDCYGCARRGDRWFLCDYHQGYDDAMAESADSPRPPF